MGLLQSFYSSSFIGSSLLGSSKNHSAHPDQFEKQLVQLELKIQNHQRKLDHLDLNQRSIQSKITFYSLATWLVYTILWYFRWTDYINPLFKNLINQKAIHSIQVLPIVVIPIGLLSCRHLIEAWYQRKQESEQLQLRLLQKQLRDKVEELKKKTAYYSTKELLERYDDKIKQSSSMTPPNPETLRQRRPTPLSTPNGIPVSTPPMPQNSVLSTNPKLPQSTITPNSLQQQQQPQSTTPSPSIGRGWADRFAEVLLGDDEARPESKYALICIKCFSHNGLVRKEELDTIRYLCPKCGTFNPARKSQSKQNNAQSEENGFSGSEEETRRTNGRTNPNNGRGKQQFPQGRKSVGELTTRTKDSSDPFQGAERRRIASFTAAPPMPSLQKYYESMAATNTNSQDTQQAYDDEQEIVEQTSESIDKTSSREGLQEANLDSVQSSPLPASQPPLAENQKASNKTPKKSKQKKSSK